MKELTKISVYGLTGDLGLIAKVVELSIQGFIVCPHASHAAGLGEYLIAYKDKPEEKTPEVVEILETVEIKEVIEEAAPDFEHAKSFLQGFEKESDAKQALINYACNFEGIEEEAFDKRKSYSKLLATFQGKWTYLSNLDQDKK